jgi:hypothetical protein
MQKDIRGVAEVRMFITVDDVQRLARERGKTISDEDAGLALLDHKASIMAAMQDGADDALMEALGWW